MPMTADMTIDEKLAHIASELQAVRATIEKLERSAQDRDSGVAEIKEDMRQIQRRKSLWGK
jgi:hypothetical protein